MERLLYDEDELERLCRRWDIEELALFGSAIREDFRPDSDVDLFVRFEPDAAWSAWDLVDLQAELEKLFGRDVDLVQPEGVRNPYRRRTMFENRRVVYAT